MTSVPANTANAFLARLQEFVCIDGAEANLMVSDDSAFSVGEDGILSRQGTGAEAVLIIVGPQEGRQRALARLLALIDTDK